MAGLVGLPSGRDTAGAQRGMLFLLLGALVLVLSGGPKASVHAAESNVSFETLRNALTRLQRKP